MGVRLRVVVFAAAAALPMAAGQAKEVRYPAAQPEISLRVPDDWSVAETPLGLELQSPQKDALVVAGLTAGDRQSIDGWSKRALARMGGEGVVFAKTGAARLAAPKVAAPDADAAKTATSNAGKPDAGKPAMPSIDAPKAANGAADLARLNGDHPYTFGGTPTVEQPKIGNEDLPLVVGHAGDADLPTISTQLGANPGAMRPSGHFAYAGGSLRGQPVDVELAVFPIGKNKRFLIEQQSGPTDARGVMIVRSLRSLDVTQ